MPDTLTQTNSTAAVPRLNYDAHARLDAKIRDEIALGDRWSLESVRTMNCHV